MTTVVAFEVAEFNAVGFPSGCLALLACCGGVLGLCFIRCGCCVLGCLLAALVNSVVFLSTIIT